jgi:hypothetical protein
MTQYTSLKYRPLATKYLCTLHLPTIGHHGKVTGTKPDWFADPPRSSIAGEPCATASVESGYFGGYLHKTRRW